MIRSRLTELRQQAVESLSNSRARTQLNTLWPVVLGFLTGTITGAFAHACLRLRVKFWPRSRSPALALWARISQARRRIMLAAARQLNHALGDYSHSRVFAID